MNIPQAKGIVTVFVKSLGNLKSSLDEVDLENISQRIEQNHLLFDEVPTETLNRIFECVGESWIILDKLRNISKISSEILELGQNMIDID